ncbi:putative membrane protein [Clostridium bornimense]|uniref:Putative membrane protein n=1 Tax=Clostridium bornimense TaxID=1216932 RepID=W6S6R8_9CLOT|nr:CDP-alcohol phosphatidyltransferase family protein [Clostridium bornimense]CDM70082.1 putative membrane protein [Clostridium bornimense]
MVPNKCNRNIVAILLINFITLSRGPMTVFFSYQLIQYLTTGIQAYSFCSMIISILIILSDFIDGKFARRYGVSTEIGQSFDIYFDFAYIFIAISILIKYSKIDSYFIIVIVYKFVEFLITSKIFKGKFQNRKSKKYYYDKLGIIVSGIYYVIPLITILLIYFEVRYSSIILRIALLVITALTFIASFMKFYDIRKIS